MRRFLLALFSHRFLAMARWDLYFLRLRLRNSITCQRTRIRNFMRSRKSPTYLNLGSGPRGKNDAHWVNVDGFADRNVHFTLGFSRPLPFDDGLFDGVFCEHVMEHFTLEEGEAIAREVHRVLRPDGVFRVIVPNAEHIIASYFKDPKTLLEWRGGDFETPMEVVNSYFRQHYEHQFLYDYETMERMLQRAGFSEIEHSDYGRGKLCHGLVIDDAKYEWESLFTEARK